MATPATLQANTLERQLPEIIERIRDKQETMNASGDYIKNPQSVFVVTNYNVNGLQGKLEVTLEIPVDVTIDPVTGALQVLAKTVYID